MAALTQAMLIPCPWCGHREDSEFTYGGDASARRATDPAAASDAEWDLFVYWRRNAKGLHTELWYHAAGCRRWFTVTRNTLTHDIERAAPVVAPEAE